MNLRLYKTAAASALVAGVFAALVLALLACVTALDRPAPPGLARYGTAWTFFLTQQDSGRLGWLPLRIQAPLQEALGADWRVLLVSRVISVPETRDERAPPVIEFVDDQSFAELLPLDRGQRPGLGDLGCIGRSGAPATLDFDALSLDLSAQAPPGLRRLAPGPAVDAWCPARLIPAFMAASGTGSGMAPEQLPLFQVFLLGPAEGLSSERLKALLASAGSFNLRGEPQLLRGWHIQPADAQRAQQQLLRLGAVLFLLAVLSVGMMVFISWIALRAGQARLRLLRAIGADLRFMLADEVRLAALVGVLAVVLALAVREPIGALLLRYAGAAGDDDPLAMDPGAWLLLIGLCAALPLIRLLLATIEALHAQAAFVLKPAHRALMSRLPAATALLLGLLTSIACAWAVISVPDLVRPPLQAYGLAPAASLQVGMPLLTRFDQIARVQAELPGVAADLGLGLLDRPLGSPSGGMPAGLSSAAVPDCVEASAMLGATPIARELLGVRLIRGEAASAPGTLSLSVAAARRCFGDAEPIGQVLKAGDTVYRVSAVHRDLDASLGQGRPLGEALLPHGAAGMNSIVLAPSVTQAAELRSRLESVGMTLTWRWQSLAALADEVFAPQTLAARVLAALTGLLLILSLLAQWVYTRLGLTALAGGLRLLKSVGAPAVWIHAHVLGPALLGIAVGVTLGAALAAELITATGMAGGLGAVVAGALLAGCSQVLLLGVQLQRHWMRPLQPRTEEQE